MPRFGRQTGPVTPFQLGRPPTLSRFTVDRQDPLRDDPERQRELWPAGKVLLLSEHGRFPVSGAELVLAAAGELGDEVADGAVLLGEQDGVAYWAVHADRAEDAWSDLRLCGTMLDGTATGLAVTAVAVLGWHRRAPFCPRCGQRSAPARAGWARRCPGCGDEEYPRVDPAVICLVHDGADHVLLARGPSWPVGRLSVLAGFVEAGESLEACVVREVAEEVGIDVSGVRYLGSQPHPFPRSLMVGFSAVADRAQPVVPADGEIAEARWVHRDEVLAAIAAGSWSDRAGPAHGRPADRDGAPDLVLPGEVSIAGQMLGAWAGAVP